MTQAVTRPTTAAAAFRRPEAMVLAALAAVGLIRLATLGTLALTDNTEARYAAIGWQMFQSGDWVTPRLYLDGRLVPFMAKPPLFFWMTALSFQIFGAGEWGARFPNFLLGILVVGATVWFGRRFWGPRVGAVAGLILASSGLFFVLAGSCVLDMALAASVCMGTMCFALFAAEDGRRRWGLLFFLSLGLGCLAKGPVAVVLVGLSVGGWVASTRRWRLFYRLPWGTGMLITALVAVPWYVLAQRATPDFLYYFLVKEHVLRYLRRDYGDLYGAGRVQPYGASWIMLVVTFLPWTLLFIRAMLGRWRDRRQAASDGRRDPWLLYVVIWGLTPAVFFTLCRQILVTYLLPGFPGLALAASVLAVRWLDSAQPVSLWNGMRVLCLGIAVMLGAGLAAEFALRVPPWQIGVTLAATVAFGALYWAAHARGEALGLFATAGLGAPLLIAVALNASSGWINESFSAKSILLEVARRPDAAREPVLLPLDDGYSADFYQEAFLRAPIEHPRRRGLELLVSRLSGPVPPVLVIRRKQWQEMEEHWRKRLSPIAETPHWLACLPRTSQASGVVRQVSAEVPARQE